MAQPIWTTPAGSIGSFPYGYPMIFNLIATPVSPATSVRYQVLAGTLPANVVLNTNNGVLSGTPALVTSDTVTTFTIRATDNLNNIRDRTFSMIVSGAAAPQFTTQSGVLLTTQDSIWTQIQIEYSNPSPNNEVIIELQQGILPPGLQISASGLIQGYPNPPTTSVTLPLIKTVGLSTVSSTSLIYCLSVTGITVGRPVTFTNTIVTLILGTTLTGVVVVTYTSNMFTIILNIQNVKNRIHIHLLNNNINNIKKLDEMVIEFKKKYKINIHLSHYDNKYYGFQRFIYTKDVLIKSNISFVLALSSLLGS
jgi:hypothetical protein